MIDLKMLATQDNTFWKHHEAYYNDEWQAISMAQFYKEHVGYAGVKVVEERSEHITSYRIYVLMSKEPV